MHGRRPRAGHPAPSEAVEPTHRHECAECVYLGTSGPTDAFREYPSIDHYWCPQGNVGLPTPIQRYGSGPHQYLAMPVRVCHPQHSRLRQTYVMAQQQGLTPPNA
jgi:hypothetical protein